MNELPRGNGRRMNVIGIRRQARVVIVADPFQAAIVRPAPLLPMSTPRRRTLILRFARTAAARLGHLLDPDI